jgi:hypothetical protein
MNTEKPTKDEVMQHLASNPVVFTLKIQKIINSFCGSCKVLARVKPNRKFTDYCNNCQKKAKEIWEQ